MVQYSSKCLKFVVLSAILGAAACATPKQAASPNPHYKIGSPYKIQGRWYYPKEDPLYDKVGLASWYGSQFQGKPTANGEIFDKARLSAAHKTLPLPSIVEVENLENGRSAVLRVNDRGPFVDDRIIDLSQAAARALGFENNGLAKVRVRYVGRADLMASAAKPGRKERKKHDLVSNPPAPTRPQSVSVAESSKKDTIADLLTSQPVAEEPLQETILPEPVSNVVWVEIGGFFDLKTVERTQLELTDLGPSQIETVEDGIGAVHTLVIGPYTDRVTAEAWLASVYDVGYARARLRYNR